MIFLGDIAHPFDARPDFSALTGAAGRQPCVVNLEGPLERNTCWLAERKLFNHPSVVDALVDIDTRVAVLANNHICDIPNGIAATQDILAHAGIGTTGAGRDLIQAAQPARFECDRRETLIVAFGWETIQCRPATPSAAGVQPLVPRLVLQRVSDLRIAYPDATLVAVFHWNFELEPHPQPAHRRLAFASIEAGADLVIAHHPHCVGGFEFHHGRLLVYSLGNWWMPQGVYFDGTLTFPNYTCLQVALEWHTDQVAKLHWFQYDRRTHIIEHVKTGLLDYNNEASDHTPYAGFSHDEYYKWFRRNRIKRKALPIYADPYADVLNACFDRYVRWRHPLVLGLKKVLGRS